MQELHSLFDKKIDDKFRRMLNRPMLLLNEPTFDEEYSNDDDFGWFLLAVDLIVENKF